MTITITQLPDQTMRNRREPADVARPARVRSQWHLRLTIGGEVSVFERDYLGSDDVPEDEWRQHTLVWAFGAPADQSVIDREALAAALAEGGELHGLLARVHAGHSVVWEGDGHWGRLSRDAGKAGYEIDHLLDSIGNKRG
jgi:hypothetical protein